MRIPDANAAMAARITKKRANISVPYLWQNRRGLSNLQQLRPIAVDPLLNKYPRTASHGHPSHRANERHDMKTSPQKNKKQKNKKQKTKKQKTINKKQKMDKPRLTSVDQ